jgi:hypothetical protein
MERGDKTTPTPHPRRRPASQHMVYHGAAEPERRRQMIGRWPLILILLSGVIAPELGAAPQPRGAADAWARFERYLATFDPVGHRVFQPLEKEVPGLTLTGSYSLWFDAFLAGNQRVGFRHRDYRVLQSQSLLELEARYRVSPGVEITSINHLLYDSAYDLQDETGLYADRTDETFRIYDDANRIVRELYLSYRTARLDLIIGKQQIVWGKMDGRYIDVINAIDQRESVQLEASDYEARRLPVWMANVTYLFGRSSLNLLWIPDFESDRNPVYGSPWFSPLVPPDDAVAWTRPDILNGRTNLLGDTIQHRSTPNWGHFSNHEVAVRLDVTMGALTWGLIYYYAWDRRPDDVIIGRQVGGGGDPTLVFERRHSRLHHFGLTADYASALSSVPLVGDLPVVFRVEALLTKDVRFADSRKQAIARDGVLNSGLAKRDTLRMAIALELALPQNTTLIFQPSLFCTFNWRDSLGVGFGSAVGDAWALIPVLSIEHPFRATRDRLRLTTTITPYFSGPERGLQGMKTRVIAKYEFSQFINGKLIYTAYSGGDRTDLYGQYSKWDNIGVEFQYEF